MKALLHFTLLLTLGLWVLTGCQGSPDASKEKGYDIRGKVVAVDGKEKTVTLDHEDIPGLMKAMQMKFPVANAQLLEGIGPGDQVQGKLKVKSGEHVISELQKR